MPARRTKEFLSEGIVSEVFNDFNSRKSTGLTQPDSMKSIVDTPEEVDGGITDETLLEAIVGTTGNPNCQKAESGSSRTLNASVGQNRHKHR